MENILPFFSQKIDELLFRIIGMLNKTSRHASVD